ncbi:Gp138 family membrane-puncturing spike protein [Pseudacidovorax intermedius]|uniref:Gp138 family membrane-puncturing spike protein n=1 Tax=Pseudacidovorax intermedius TaxID=433924 RepID=UPI0026ECC66A|nr:Gp138 family membrane-puncturing spike protein [Pseudacidovorax intermedius]
MSQGTNYPVSTGQAWYGSEEKRLEMQIRGLMCEVHTALPAKVMAVTNDGGVARIGRVDVMPMVGQLDGAGVVVPHSVIHDVPYLRIQGGRNAVILDPEVGDLGLIAFAERDMSAVKESQDVGPPGSNRRHDMADAVYLMSIMSLDPEQYLRFHADGIELYSPTEVKIRAPKVTIEAAEEIASSAPSIVQTATGSVSQTAPLIGLNGAITQAVAVGGHTDVQLVSPVNVQQEIHSDTDVTAQTVSLHGHTHYENGEGEQTNPPTA